VIFGLKCDWHGAILHDMSTDLIERIRNAVSERGISRSGLARAAGLHPNSLRSLDEEDWNPTAETLKKLGDFASKIQPIFISIDPERDQPRQLREYVNSFDSRILPLAGSPDRTARSAHSFGVSYFKVPGLRAGDYTIAHSTFMAVVGPEGGLVARLSTDRTSDQIVSQLRKLMDIGRS